MKSADTVGRGQAETALITGSSRGIGAATARAFALAGYNVVINFNRSDQAAELLRAELVAEGVAAERLLVVGADVARSDEVLEMFDLAIERFGQVDVLVNNAGIAGSRLFTEQSEADWDEIFSVNVKGVFNCCKAALPAMIHRKAGRIINVSSIWGQVGAACEVGYSATKGAIDAFTKALAKEVGPSGIRVNAVSPGVIDTEMNDELTPADLEALAAATPLCRLGQAAEVAALILFLAGREADFITGQVVSVNGGFVIA